MVGHRVAIPVVLLLASLGGAAGDSGHDALEAAIRMQQARVGALQAEAARLALLGGRRGGGAGRIAPDLQPVSDKKFFGHHGDFPTDTRPEVVHHFEHPYPFVEDDRTFDADFVKDENGDAHDRADWDAQLTYDTLRTKLAREKEELAYAQKKAGKAAASADAKHGSAGAAAAKHADIAAEHADIAAKVDDKEEDVEDGVKNLDDCKAQLEEAKRKLNELMRKQDVAKAEEAAAHAKTEEVQAEAAAADAEEEKLEADVKEERAEQDEAEKTYGEAKKDHDKMEKDLEKAEASLRRFRNEEFGKAKAEGRATEANPCPPGCKSSGWFGLRGAGAGVAPGAPVLALLLAAGLGRAA